LHRKSFGTTLFGGGKISDSDPNSHLSKISDSDSDFPKFPTPTPNFDSGVSKISDSDSLTQRERNLTVKINGNRGVHQEISVSTKVLKEIVQFQQEFPV